MRPDAGRAPLRGVLDGFAVLLNRLYVIADAEVLAGRGVSLDEFARELRAAGVGWVQWRDKVGSPQEVLRGAAVLREVFGEGITPRQTERPSDMGRPVLIMNDRADLAVLADFEGVHVGQGDLSPEDARAVVGTHCIIGVSTRDEGGCGGGGWVRGGAAGACAHRKAAGGDWRNYAGECAQRDRGGRGFGGGDLRIVCAGRERGEGGTGLSRDFAVELTQRG